MHPIELRDEAARLAEQGLSFRAIGRELDVHKDTVRYWLRAAKPRIDHSRCPGCGEPLPSPVRVTGPSYAFLLFAYLGDGAIVRVQPEKRSLRLTITLDDAYPDLQRAVLGVVEFTFPGANARLVNRATGCQDVLVHHTHLACVFPQHGPGRKHHRRIALEPWQWEHVRAHPWEALRGAIYTDGCVCENRMTIRGRRYSYTTYDFSNRSDDILGIVRDVAEHVDLRPKRNGHGIRWARRPDVAQLQEHVGTKERVPVDDLRARWEAAPACPGWDSNPH